MLQVPYYFRAEDYLYQLQSHPEYWFQTGWSEKKQVIIGLLERNLIVLTFSPNGDFLKNVETICSLDNLFVASNRVDLDRLQNIVQELIVKYYEEGGLIDDTIKIKRFRIPELNVGIEDFPDDIQEYILMPTRFTPAERVELEETRQAWKEETLSVFWWGQSFTVDEEGFVTAS